VNVRSGTAGCWAVVVAVEVVVVVCCDAARMAAVDAMSAADNKVRIAVEFMVTSRL
jgi:hypothetical protein